MPALKKNDFQALIRRALNEDQARQDITSQILVQLSLSAQACIFAKQDLVFCGGALAREVFHQVDSQLKFQLKVKDGQRIKPGQSVLTVQGRARSILAGERVALNFLQRLSGIATLTKQYVDELQGTGVKLLDTRKTTPTLRTLERHAVACGGGVNHRFDLSAAVMVKDNHRALAGNLSQIVQKLKTKVKTHSKKIPLIIEVETLTEAKEVLAAGARYLQCDNMRTSQLKNVVNYVRQHYGKTVKLEATGGITLKNIRKVALSGVDYISVGAITHSAPAVDLSLEIT